MHSPVKDPRSLTKEKLKIELSNHNVSLPPSDSRKDVYVDLYREHILAPATSSSEGLRREVDSRRSKLEAFSSDEDEDSDSPAHTETRMSNGEADPLTAQEVDGLSDDDLYMALARRGQTVGPILDSTRRVYQKRLRKLLADETEASVEYVNGEANGHNEQEFSDQEEEDEEPMETEEVVPAYNPAPAHTTRQRQPEKAFSDHRQATVTRQQRDETVVTKTTVARENAAVAREQRVPPPSDAGPTITHRSSHRTVKSNSSSDGEKRLGHDLVKQVNETSSETLAHIDSRHAELKKRQGISVWLQVFIIAVCALIVFLVLSNMEPAYQNPAELADGQTV